MTCAVCGATLNENARFCGTCGRTVPREPKRSGNQSLKALVYRSACRRYGQALNTRPYTREAPMLRIA